MIQNLLGSQQEWVQDSGEEGPRSNSHFSPKKLDLLTPVSFIHAPAVRAGADPGFWSRGDQTPKPKFALGALAPMCTPKYI